ncbi:CPXCG motif-containing cysteine-rich protein [Marinicella sp. W31]|uniref:CPXCG motif-containing cysteine-rich protein n=1 Tax=Marinicella sp. W31 TaxID=3023713 RepID=UPI00375713D8
MLGLETQRVQCPFCWEYFDIVLDCSVEEQEYIEDCYVCCRPINFRVSISADDAIQVEALSDDE